MGGSQSCTVLTMSLDQVLVNKAAARVDVVGRLVERQG